MLRPSSRDRGASARDGHRDGGHYSTLAPRPGWSSLRGADIAAVTPPVHSSDEIASGPALCAACSSEGAGLLSGNRLNLRARIQFPFTDRLPDIARYEGFSVLSRGVLTGSPQRGLGSRCRSFADRCRTCSAARLPFRPCRTISESDDRQTKQRERGDARELHWGVLYRA